METLGSTVRYGHAASMLVGVNGLALHVVGTGKPLWLLVALAVAAVIVSFAAERVFPYNEEWNRSHGDALRDGLHALVNEASNYATLLLLPVFAALVPFDGLWPHGWPFVLQVVFAVIVVDVGITLTHYASHRLELLWRFHAVHHSVKRMYGFNGLMKHPVHQTIETVVGTLPLLLLGLPSDVAVCLVFAVVIQLLLQHSNVDYTVGPLRHALATSEVHRFHHRKEAGLGDVNFGLFTTLCDHLLGTFHDEDRDARFASDELGIGAEPDYPIDYLPQLVRPFRRSGTAALVAAD